MYPSDSKKIPPLKSVQKSKSAKKVRVSTSDLLFNTPTKTSRDTLRNRISARQKRHRDRREPHPSKKRPKSKGKKRKNRRKKQRDSDLDNSCMVVNLPFLAASPGKFHDSHLHNTDSDDGMKTEELSDEEIDTLESTPLMSQIKSVFELPGQLTPIKPLTSFRDLLQQLWEIDDIIYNRTAKDGWPFPTVDRSVLKTIILSLNLEYENPSDGKNLQLFHHIYSNSSRKHHFQLWPKCISFLLKYHGLSRAGVNSLRRLYPLPAPQTTLRFNDTLCTLMKTMGQGIPTSKLLVSNFDNHQISTLHHQLRVGEDQNTQLNMLLGSVARVPASCQTNVPDFCEVHKYTSLSGDIFLPTDDGLSTFDSAISNWFDKFQTTTFRTMLIELLSLSTFVKSSLLSELPKQVNSDGRDIYVRDINEFDPNHMFYTLPPIINAVTKGSIQKFLESCVDFKLSPFVDKSKGMLPEMRMTTDLLRSWKRNFPHLWSIIIQNQVVPSKNSYQLFSDLSKSDSMSYSKVDITHAQDPSTFLSMISSTQTDPTDTVWLSGIICGVDQKIYSPIISMASEFSDSRFFPILGEMHMTFNISANAILLLKASSVGKSIFSACSVKVMIDGSVGTIKGSRMERTIDFFTLLGLSIESFENSFSSLEKRSTLGRKYQKILQTKSWKFLSHIRDIALAIYSLNIAHILVDVDLYMESLRRLVVYTHSFPSGSLSDYKSSMVDYYCSLYRLPKPYQKVILSAAGYDPGYMKTTTSNRRQPLDWGNEYLNLSMNHIATGEATEENVTKFGRFTMVALLLRHHLYHILKIKRVDYPERSKSTEILIMLFWGIKEYFGTFDPETEFIGRDFRSLDVSFMLSRITLFLRQTGSRNLVDNVWNKVQKLKNGE